MGILQLPYPYVGQSGLIPDMRPLATTANLAAITTAGYLNSVNLEGFPLANNSILEVLYSYNQQTNSGTFGIFSVSIVNGVITLALVSQSQAGPVVVTDALASAAPGTVRAFTGAISDSVLMTSGNIVGVRGQVTSAGASGGFLYGVQGKVIVTGTLSGSEWTAGVFGQLDISAATINAGQVAAIWGDYGASSGTLTNQTGLYGIAMTNTTAAVLAGQVYLYGGAQNLLLLNTNAGLSGVTYFINSGVSAGSWGNATPPTPSKVLRISVDGTQYYLPLVAQNT